MRPDRNLRFAPAKADVGVMPLLFGYFTDAIHKFERFAKIAELASLLQMMLVYNFPTGDLRRQRLDLSAR
jgi:hypothetical protein